MGRLFYGLKKYDDDEKSKERRATVGAPSAQGRGRAGDKKVVCTGADGGNLLPFAQMGCYTLGVDISEGRIADACIEELMSIKGTKTSIELFEQLLKTIGKFIITDRTLWLINPHYETKFDYSE